MEQVFSTKVKIPPFIHSLPGSTRATLAACGKVAPSCTVTKDPTLPYITRTEHCWAHYRIRGKALWAKDSFQIGSSCSFRSQLWLCGSMWGWNITSFPKWNSTYRRPYKHFSNTYQHVLARVILVKALHMHFSSSTHFSHIFKCCAKLMLARVATIFLFILNLNLLNLFSLCLLLLYAKPQNGFEFYLKVKNFRRSPNNRLLEREEYMAGSTTALTSVWLSGRATKLNLQGIYDEQ